MQSLNFPFLPEKVVVKDGQAKVFDVVRKKWYLLTPEEWVRQHLILFLNKEKGCPLSLMAVEKALQYNGMLRRSDLVVYSTDTTPLLLAECKAPEIRITESVFDQVARYNMSLRVPFLMVTNGLQHFCCKIDFEKESYSFLNTIPDYDQLKTGKDKN
jgi:type I site-specific restriction endonuclease